MSLNPEPVNPENDDVQGASTGPDLSESGDVGSSSTPAPVNPYVPSMGSSVQEPSALDLPPLSLADPLAGAGAPSTGAPTAPNPYDAPVQAAPSAGPSYGTPPPTSQPGPQGAPYGQPPMGAYGQPPAGAYGQPQAGAYGAPYPGAGYGPVNGQAKSRVAAGLFGIFLGSLGIHRFYLGYSGIGLAMLLISVLSLGFLAPFIAVWGLVEGILYLTAQRGSYSVDAAGRPLTS